MHELAYLLSHTLKAQMNKINHIKLPLSIEKTAKQKQSQSI